VIELEITTIVPPLDPAAQTLSICDPETGAFIGVNKAQWMLYDYDFDLTIFQEIYNVLHLSSGHCELSYVI